MQIFIQTGLQVALDWPGGYSSYQIEKIPRSIHASLVLREEGKEKIPLLDILTVIRVRAIDRRCKGSLGRIGRVYAKNLKQFLRLARHERLEENGGDTKRFRHVVEGPLGVGRFPRLRRVEVFVSLIGGKKKGY